MDIRTEFRKLVTTGKIGRLFTTEELLDTKHASTNIRIPFLYQDKEAMIREQSSTIVELCDQLQFTIQLLDHYALINPNGTPKEVNHAEEESSKGSKTPQEGSQEVS